MYLLKRNEAHLPCGGIVADTDSNCD